ncbi:MAG: hypothetical protein B7Z55_03875 [Planctomycetales bacterium 12-60-4]|nr:MAG: hypothetical protein B7Z55_03875 [Planctomycetales bacterium 12-60-4]
MWDYHFVDHWMTPYWEANSRARRRELISVQRTEDVATSLREWLSRPLEQAATVGVFRTSSRDTVCFRVDHRLADATSLRLFVAAVAKHYRAGSTPPQADAPIVRRTPRLLRRAVSRDMRRNLLSESRKLDYRERRRNAAFVLPAATDTDPNTFPRQLHYPAGAVAQLTARAMRDRATINMAIQAALTLAIRDVIPLKPGREIPQQHLVDLRRYLPLEERDIAACMLIGAAQTWLSDQHATSMEAALSEIRQQLNAQRGPKFGLVISPLPADLPFIRVGLRWIPYRMIRRGMRRVRVDCRRFPPVSPLAAHG